MEKKTKDMQSTIISLEPITFDHALYTQEDIQSRIFTIRGQHVMLDSDIARLYGMETKRINQQVSRNPIKFPERYVFQLTAEEVQSLKLQNVTSNTSSRSQDATLNNEADAEAVENQNENLTSSRSLYATLNAEGTLKSQNATSKNARGKNIKYLPYVFSERGASMLATVIKGEAALQYPTARFNVHEFQCSHDRFLIIDDKVYHFGASIKDLGKRWFGVNLITEYSADDLIARL